MTTRRPKLDDVLEEFGKGLTAAGVRLPPGVSASDLARAMFAEADASFSPEMQAEVLRVGAEVRAKHPGPVSDPALRAALQKALADLAARWKREGKVPPASA